MAVMSFVFSVRAGDILNLHMATHDAQLATKYVFDHLDPRKPYWFRLFEFPTIREYGVGDRVNVILDYDWKTGRVDLTEVCGVNETPSPESRDESLWSDVVVVS